MRIIRSNLWIVLVIVMVASACASTPTAAAVTTTTIPAATTTVTSTTVTIDGSLRAPTLRTLLNSDGYGYLVNGATDGSIDAVGVATCALADSSLSRELFVAATLRASAGTYTVAETAELSVAALIIYCPGTVDRWDGS